jgi:hypothetical protein
MKNIGFMYIAIYEKVKPLKEYQKYGYELLIS